MANALLHLQNWRIITLICVFGNAQAFFAGQLTTSPVNVIATGLTSTVRIDLQSNGYPAYELKSNPGEPRIALDAAFRESLEAAERGETYVCGSDGQWRFTYRKLERTHSETSPGASALAADFSGENGGIS